MSATDGTLEQLLSELRELAVEVAPIAAHLERIDTQLAQLPQGAVVDELRADIDALKEAVAELRAFQEGPPPLAARLKALEEAVAAENTATKEREEAAAEVAGTATDTEHRDMAREEAEPLVAASEQRVGKELRTLGEIVTAQGKRLEKLVDVALENRWVSVAGVLLVSAILYVLVQVVPW